MGKCSQLCLTTDCSPASKIALSFNGGKDCTVVLHLLQDFLKENSTVNLRDFHFVHFEQSNEFEEVVAFRKQVEQKLGISI